MFGELLEKAKLRFAYDDEVLDGINNGSVKAIPVGRCRLSIVDQDDYDKISKYSWFVKKGRYTCYAGRRDCCKKTTSLHREILNLKRGDPIIDHKNGNGLDNRKCNLRVSTYEINNFNAKIRTDNISGYRGVSWHRRTKKWCVQISVNKKIIHGGYYSNPQAAAMAYDKLAIINRGEDAKLNFPERKDCHDFSKPIHGETGTYYRTHRGKSVVACSLAAQTWRRSNGDKPSA